MLSRLTLKCLSFRFATKTKGVIRTFAETAKEQSSSSNQKLIITLAISGPLCYGVYAYATDKWFHEMLDEKCLYHMPWVMKMMNKWFPCVIDSPYAIRVLIWWYTNDIEIKEAPRPERGTWWRVYRHRFDKGYDRYIFVMPRIWNDSKWCRCIYASCKLFSTIITFSC